MARDQQLRSLGPYRIGTAHDAGGFYAGLRGPDGGLLRFVYIDPFPTRQHSMSRDYDWTQLQEDYAHAKALRLGPLRLNLSTSGLGRPGWGWRPGGRGGPERRAGLIVAIYASKSTDQGNRLDEAKSVTRQMEHATAYAARKGWTVDPAHVYVDDGISGTEFVKRPGFLRLMDALMNALKPRPALQGLVMSEESRLGREQIETAYALKQLVDARGARVLLPRRL